MDHDGSRFRQNMRLRLSRDRSRSPAFKSRSRSPREWKRNERRPAEREGAFNRDRNRDPHAKIRLCVANIPYDVRWQDLKDLFREKVGNASDITYVELYNGPDGKPCGTGVVEVRGAEMARKAIDILHRSEIKGRRIVVREEVEEDRVGQFKQQRTPGQSFDNDINMGGNSSFANLMTNSSGQMNNSQQNLAASMLSNAAAGLLGAISGGGGMMGNAVNMLNMVGAGNGSLTNTMNLAGSSVNVQQLLIQLGIDPATITNQVFVANLDYKVTASKMEEVFRIAGNVIEVDIKTDKDGRSRGMGTVRFEHPMEAVQAVSLFNQQFLYERQMAVRMDKWVDPILQDIPGRMPTGLKGIGSGFGTGGQPLLNIAQISNTLTLCALTGQLTLPSTSVNAVQSGSNLGGMGGGIFGLGNNGMMGSNNIPNLMGSLSGGAGILGSGLGMSGGGSNNILSGGMNAGGSGLGIGNSMSDNNLMSSGLGGSNFLGRLGGNALSGLTEGHNDFELQGGGIMYNTGSGGMSSSTGLGTSNRFNAMDRNMDYNSSMDRGGSGNLDRHNRGFAGSSDTFNRNESGNTTVFVRNIPFSWTWQDLMSKFKDCGEVRTANVKLEGGRSRGMGTVSFYSAEDARRAIDIMDGARLDGREIEVRLDRVL